MEWIVEVLVAKLRKAFCLWWTTECNSKRYPYESLIRGGGVGGRSGKGKDPKDCLKALLHCTLVVIYYLIWVDCFEKVICRPVFMTD